MSDDKYGIFLKCVSVHLGHIQILSKIIFQFKLHLLARQDIAVRAMIINLRSCISSHLMLHKTFLVKLEGSYWHAPIYLHSLVKYFDGQS